MQESQRKFGMLRAATVVLYFVTYQSTVHAQEATLTYLQNNPFGNVYRYQARCSLPCSGIYSPGTFKVTVNLDKICSNFQTFGNFALAQTTTSAVWYLNNTNLISGNSAGKCSFDIQMDHAPRDPVPTGTCKLGWETPRDCLVADQDGPVLNGWMTCFDVAIEQPNECYNQTMFSKCCSVCNDHRSTLVNCPFGDLEPSQCTTLRNNACYNTYTEQNCCETCDNIANEIEPKIDGCRYGDRSPNFCLNLVDDSECYEHADRCCLTCSFMYDSDNPECPYGNRKQDFCNRVSIFDCYNTTIEYDCCGLCSELRNYQNPDCPYGDRHSTCNSILSRDCYRTTITDTCCDTCVQLADNQHPDCAYGDRRDCSDISEKDCSSADVQYECCQTCRFLQENNCGAVSADQEPLRCYDIESRDCYNPNTRNDCCFTCNQFYQDNAHLNAETCPFGDRRNNCYRITPRQCYNPGTRDACCETCSYYAYNEENCAFGDRTPNNCWINSTECYDVGVETDCCETCSYYVQSDLPTNCRYGDKEGRCSTIAPYECYSRDVFEACCETCQYFDQSDELGSGCRYGDRRSDCYVDEPYICYDPDQRGDCCKFCQTLENVDNVGCEFGDKDPSCGGILSGDCYNRENICCATCPRIVSPYKIDNCKYGDRGNCSTILDSDCYDAAISFKCCETCWLRSNGNTNDCAFGDSASDCSNIDPWACYTREFECCQTCRNHLSDITDISYCKYGDRSDDCNTITADQCYDQDTQYKCCETCYHKRRNDLPASCRYGDKNNMCKSSQFHGSECYNGNVRDECCEACLGLKTNILSCEYGDQDALCKDASQARYVCYNQTVYRQCCSSCPELADTFQPGCEFGDIYQFCDQTRCDEYAPFRLQQCCDTCWGYTHQTSHSSTDYISTYFSTTTGQPGNKGEQTSKGGGFSIFKTTTSSALRSTTHRKTSKDVDDDFDDDNYGDEKEDLPETRATRIFTRPTRTFRPRTTSHEGSGEDENGEEKNHDRSTVIATRASSSPRPGTSTGANLENGVNDFIGSTLPIVGGVIGGVLLIAIIIIAACFVMRRNRNKGKERSKTPPFTNLDASRPDRSVHSYIQNGQRNAAIGNPGYKSRANKHPPQPNKASAPHKPAPKRQDSKKDEEVYDYIDDNDVRSLPSIKRPAVPDRDSEVVGQQEGYMELEASGEDNQYLNPAYHQDSGDYHQYHVLQKDPQANNEREYMHL